MQTYFLIMKIPKPAQNHLPSLASTIIDNLSFLPFSLMLENFKANLSYYVTFYLPNNVVVNMSSNPVGSSDSK